MAFWSRSKRKTQTPANDTGKAWNRYIDRVTLFDVERDPGETTDLSGSAEYADDGEDEPWVDTLFHSRF